MDLISSVLAIRTRHATNPWDVNAQVHNEECERKEDGAFISKIPPQVKELTLPTAGKSGLDEESGGNHQDQLHEGDNAQSPVERKALFIEKLIREDRPNDSCKKEHDIR